MLEAHARPIGGLCARTLRLVEPSGGEGTGEPWVTPWVAPYEELILRHALGEDVSGFRLAHGASGVMMIPIPKGGVYRSVEGLEEASKGIEEIIITATPGQRLIPLPEGSSYLGFIFARGNSPQEVEAALRQAHSGLRFDIATALETFSPVMRTDG